MGDGHMGEGQMMSELYQENMKRQNKTGDGRTGWPSYVSCWEA